ncbi:MAG: 2-C-methyl-D-erythritol 4-phosphate cytidylyltransferase [Lachnospiraceae bacterium]
MKTAAVVLAAGSGRRMQSSVKKQYMEINGKPVIYYSIHAFEAAGIDEIILVVSESEINWCQKEIVERYHLSKVSKIVAGGKERYDSVYAALSAIDSADYVLIHDGARPCVSSEVIWRTVEAAKETGASVAAVPVKDTIKVVNQQGLAESTPDRSTLWAIQTPQTFDFSLIKEAYEKMYDSFANGVHDVKITDDAMVVEHFSDHSVKIAMGDYRNIKLTTPDDIPVAEQYLRF